MRDGRRRDVGAQGRNGSLWPGYAVDFRRRTRRIAPEDHELIG
jgi:hypothetical protein